MEALAEQATLHVREGDDDRVDLAGCDVPLELVERQHRAILFGRAGCGARLDTRRSLTCLDTGAAA